jgi:N6-adenosine-specific RNA methylase IME4
MKMAPKIDPEFAALIPPLTSEERAGLEDSITKEGCRDPLVVWIQEDILLDGHNRYEICDRLGKPFNTVGMSFQDRNAAKEWVIRNQFARRNLIPWQRAKLASQLKAILQPLARARMLAGRRVDPVQTLGQGDQSRDGRVDEMIAKVAGLSAETIRKTDALFENADEATKTKLDAGLLSIEAAYQQMRAAGRKAVVEGIRQQIASEPPPPPDGPFRVIVCDPPWPVDFPLPYPTMSLDEIFALPVQQFAHPDCVLWLWCVNSLIPEAYRVIDTWGFTRRGFLTWDKVRPGCGPWLRGQTEHVILAIRGNPPLPPDVPTTIIREEKRENSRKPEAFYQLVEHHSSGSRVDLFAREQRTGWESWGAESLKFRRPSAGGATEPHTKEAA